MYVSVTRRPVSVSEQITVNYGSPLIIRDLTRNYILLFNYTYSVFIVLHSDRCCGSQANVMATPIIFNVILWILCKRSVRPLFRLSPIGVWYVGSTVCNQWNVFESAYDSTFGLVIWKSTEFCRVPCWEVTKRSYIKVIYNMDYNCTGNPSQCGYIGRQLIYRGRQGNVLCTLTFVSRM